MLPILVEEPADLPRSHWRVPLLRRLVSIADHRKKTHLCFRCDLAHAKGRTRTSRCCRSEATLRQPGIPRPAKMPLRQSSRSVAAQRLRTEYLHQSKAREYDVQPEFWRPSGAVQF